MSFYTLSICFLFFCFFLFRENDVWNGAEANQKPRVTLSMYGEAHGLQFWALGQWSSFNKFDHSPEQILWPATWAEALVLVNWNSIHGPSST